MSVRLAACALLVLGSAGLGGCAALPAAGWAAIGAGFGFGTAVVTLDDHVIMWELGQQPTSGPILVPTPGPKP